MFELDVLECQGVVVGYTTAPSGWIEPDRIFFARGGRQGENQSKETVLVMKSIPPRSSRITK